MKHFFQQLLIVAAGLILQNAHAQSSAAAKPTDTTINYYKRLANSENAGDKILLETQLYSLLKSKKEKDWLLAQRFFYELKKINVADSINDACKIQFPLGEVERDEETKAIYDEADAVKKEAAYKKWITKFPPVKFGTERIVYDYARNAVARAYANDDKVKKAIQYANMTETGAWKGEGWAGIANVLIKNNHLSEGAELLRKAVANSYKYMNVPNPDNAAKFAASGYNSYAASLADVLYQQKKYTESLKYIKAAHNNSKTVKANINSTYANILMALGKNDEAFEMINEAVKEGQATVAMKENLKTLYAKVKGSNAGYDEYMVSLNKILIEKMRKEVAKQIISKPAVMFTLQDVDGKTVSLEDYKGKTIVLDFWATWCGPCKRSFPAMKLAVNKYKDDPDVKFFFIHTWEKEEEAAKKAKKYIDDQKYPFEVLMDLKETTTGVNKVVESYKVTSIPAKFVIDKNGNIRFALSGFSGGDDAAVEELSAMIEMAQK